MHAARNYGAVLQTYALQFFLEKKGCSVDVVDYRRKNQTFWGYLFNVNAKFKSSLVRSLAFIAKSFLPKLRTSNLFSAFLKRKINLTVPVKSSNDIASKVKSDLYCTGSDQVWNPIANNGFDPSYFFSGLTPKVSYAASIGLHNLSDDYKTELKNFLSTYNSVSIRELSSKNILNDIKIDSEVVLDPTLLLNRENWDQFADFSTVPNFKYLLVYYFGNNRDIMKTAADIAYKKHLRVVRLSVAFDNYNEDDVVFRFITPEQFVALFSKASFVLTNSFHGTAFSINYGIDFLSYPTTENNARFDSIFDMFDLHYRNLRKVENPSVAADMPIDWNSVKDILEKQREFSYKFIEDKILCC